MNIYIYVYVFNFFTGHHGRIVHLNGLPCIDTFEIKRIENSTSISLPHYADALEMFEFLNCLSGKFCRVCV